ncbi:MAG: hypothetical protein ACR2JJ_04880 [Sphingomicrobium sp.]
MNRTLPQPVTDLRRAAAFFGELSLGSLPAGIAVDHFVMNEVIDFRLMPALRAN